MKRQPDFKKRNALLLLLLLLLVSGTSAYPGTANTTRYLTMNGTHGSTGFADETGNGTAATNAIIDTTLPHFGNGSARLSGSTTTNRIDLAAANDLVFGGDFTVDGYFNASSVANSPRIFGIANTQLTIQLVSTTEIDAYVGGNLFKNNSCNYPVNNLHYFKLLRRGSTCDLYIDNTLIATYASCTGTINAAGAGLSIGNYQTGGGTQAFSGHIDDFRVVRGYADLGGIPTAERLATGSDTTPPASIQGLHNTTALCNSTQWNWTNPLDSDFAELITYKNGGLLENLPNTTIGRTWTGLSEGTEYTISTHTKDLAGNINSTWINATMQTAVCSVPPTPTPTPAPGISGMYPRFDSNETEGSAPLPVSFYDESIGNITDRLWSFGDGNTAADQNPEYVYNGSGIFDVSLYINGTDGNATFTKTRLIKVIGGSPGPAAAGPVIMPSTPGSWDEILGDRIGRILDIIFGE